MNITIFAIVFTAAILFFLWSCYARFSLIFVGKADNRMDNIGLRTWNMLLFAFGQRKVVSGSYPFGINHFVFFWCFLILMIANTEFLFHGLFPQVVALSLLPAPAYHALAAIFDIVSLLALLAVLLAMARRLFFAPRYIEARTADAFVVLGLVGILMLAFFGLHGCEISAVTEKAAAFMPVSSAASLIFSGLPETALHTAASIFWWLHAVVLLVFLNYLPYSKHMHILTSIPNCFFKSLEKVNTQPREEFVKGNKFGAGTIDQFRWKDLFDSYSCTECGRCTDNCPATTTGKPLNPRLVVHEMKINLLGNAAQLKKKTAPVVDLIGHSDGHGTISEETIWSCTTCGACMEVCPVSIEHVPKLVYMRRHLVETQARFPAELKTLFANIEGRSNPWGIIPQERAKWAADIDAKPFKEGNTEYLLYVGCAGSLDSRNKKNTVALAKILNAAGVSWGILGKDEMCCGDSLRRLGNEYIFEHMAKDNIKMLTERGVSKIITQCPHCFSTLRNDYKQYGADFEVMHHTTFINRLLKEDKLPLKKDGSTGKIVFHDSCYLGRYNDVFHEPREIISRVTGNAPLEMKRNYERSFCCGAGGGRMWMEENTGTRINLERVEEAMTHNPDAICVCCPYCVSMFEDGVRDKNATGKVAVVELSELVAKSL